MCPFGGETNGAADRLQLCGETAKVRRILARVKGTRRSAMRALLEQTASSRQRLGLAPELAEILFRKRMPLIGNRCEPATRVGGLEGEPPPGKARRERDADASRDTAFPAAPFARMRRRPRGSVATVAGASFTPRGDDIPGVPDYIQIIAKASMGGHFPFLGHSSCLK